MYADSWSKDLVNLHFYNYRQLITRPPWPGKALGNSAVSSPQEGLLTYTHKRYFASGTGAAGLVGAFAWWELRGLGVRVGVGISSVRFGKYAQERARLTIH